MLAVTAPSFVAGQYGSGISYVDAKLTEIKNGAHIFRFRYPAPLNPELGSYSFVMNVSDMSLPWVMAADLGGMDFHELIRQYTFDLRVEVDSFQIEEENGIVTASAKLSHYNEFDLKPYIILTAQDKMTGLLERVALDNTAVITDGWMESSLLVYLDIGVNNVDNYNYKAYVWEGLTEMKPLTGVVDTITR